MQPKHYLLAFVVAVVLSVLTPRSEAQVIGGYVGYGSPGVVTYGAPVIAPAPVFAAPVVPYTTVVAPRPWIGPRPRYYGPGWGYPTPYYGTRVVYPRSRYVYGAGPRWW